jgi:type II secretory pathway component GspD/PulD (secretin)
MVLESRFSCRGYSRTFVAVFAIIIVLGGSYVLIAEQKDAIELKRYRVFSLKNISAEQGKKFLADANIGTVSQIPGSNTLLVTAQPVELIKASAILGVVDSKEEFVMKELFPASQASNMPSREKIASKMGDILIGSFLEPPIGEAKSRAIIDVHNDAVVVIAEAGKVEQIISAIERLKEAETKAPQMAELPRPAETNQPFPAQKQADQTPKDANKPKAEAVAKAKPKAAEEKASAGDSESDKLLGLLDKAEKMAARTTAGRQVRPKEPNVAAAVSEQIAKVGPSAGAEQPPTKLEEITQAAEKPQSPAEVPDVNKVAEKAAPAAEAKAEKPTPESSPAEEQTPAASRLYTPEPVAGTDETLELDLPEKINIIDLLDLVGKYLHLDYVYDATEVAGKEVSLKVQGPIKVKDLYPLMESVLKFKGFVTSRKGNLVTITAREKALDIDPALVTTSEGKIRFGDVVITRIYDLKYMFTAPAKTLLESMKLGVVVTVIPDSKKIIVTGYANTMSRVDELLEIFDKPGEPKQFKYRQLKYTMAKSLVDQIKKLVEKLGGTVSIGAISTSEPSAPAPPPGRPVRQIPPPSQPSQPSGSSTPALSVYLDFDERTNRILMIGLKSELDIVEELVTVLDVAQQDLRSLRLYEIQHVGAEEVREKLAELGIISGGAGVGGGRITRKAGAQQGAPQPAQAGGTTEGLLEEPQVIVIESTNSLLVNATPEQHAQIAMIIGFTDSETLEHAIPYEIYSLENQDPLKLAEVLNKLIQETVKDKEGKIEKVVKKEEDIIIVPDENTFSIIVYASRKNQEWIKKLIKSLDKRRPQVLLDATLVAITRGDQFNFDLDMVTKFPKLAPGGSMSMLTPLLQDANSGFPDETIIEATTGVGGGGTMEGKGFYSDEHIQALLTIMQAKNYGRILAQPKVLVNDNEKGTIKTERTLYVARTAEVLPSQPATTGTSGFVTSSTTFEAYPSGITLEITPHISEGDLLRLEISLIRSSQQSPRVRLPNQPPPDKEENNIKTIVTVPNRSTIILGGVLTLDQGKTVSKIPLLGDIPIVGGLFRSIGNSDSESKLYVFVKAYILRPGETAGLPELVKESKNYRDAFEKSEREFQEYEEWPGIKSAPMEPNRTLDAK